jgi:3'-5' exoribonuclease
VKDRFVADFEPNETITSHFLVQSKEIRLRKTGEPYLALILSDRTGQLEAKKWDDIEEVADTFDRDDFVKVNGLIQNYRDRPQMTIHRLRRAEESEIELADYLPHTTRDVEEMFAELRAAVDEIGNPHLKKLLQSFLDDPEVASRLKRAPAAKTLHHAFIGGLLEHILSLLNLARLTVQNYAHIDLDLVKTGVVLHDIGKIHELTYGRSFGYSSEGQLLGHITIGLRMLDQKFTQLPDFPPRLRLLVEHLILSHHGKYEFGSPKLPMFAEAILLHYLDDLDSKLENIRATLAADHLSGEEWTRYSPSLERVLLKKDQFLEVTPNSGQASNTSSTGGGGPDLAPASRASSSGTSPAGKPLSLFGERLQAAIEIEDKGT